MKKKFILMLSMISCLSFAQVGIYTDAPTATLDVNGNTRVRNLTGTTNNSTLYPNSVVVTSNDGTLANSSALNILYSSGIYRWSDSNNNWTNIRTGTKEARLDFTGRASISGLPAITFSLLYKVGSTMTIIQNPVVSSGATGTITNITANSFTLTITMPSSAPQVFNFTFTTTNGITSINAGNAGGTFWIQGTWHSIPNLN
ncbi:hypothetical protein [Chryseobacterium sp. StRB126]|uniref:hypothetical protein n=1 Tax=Chryseobacterium sp. StRB126 TaxID=878220 RepID=UPI0005EF1495|nr:hypothetical protein [Chryseobacterium sp. StRB126]